VNVRDDEDTHSDSPYPIVELNPVRRWRNEATGGRPTRVSEPAARGPHTGKFQLCDLRGQLSRFYFVHARRRK
jgi:hypothetical protein